MCNLNTCAGLPTSSPCQHRGIYILVTWIHVQNYLVVVVVFLVSMEVGVTWIHVQVYLAVFLASIEVYVTWIHVPSFPCQHEGGMSAGDVIVAVMFVFAAGWVLSVRQGGSTAGRSASPGHLGPLWRWERVQVLTAVCVHGACVCWLGVGWGGGGSASPCHLGAVWRWERVEYWQRFFFWGGGGGEVGGFGQFFCDTQMALMVYGQHLLTLWCVQV